MAGWLSPELPPRIDGFTPLATIGSGGFSDVFVYEQAMPRRRVAVKVLRDALSGAARRQFEVEANLMARLSTHPAIVTIYLAGVTTDGRPFLAMEYCPGGSLAARYRGQLVELAEALRIGIEVAGAVETAHRAGIVHRDIKPANILLTEYGRPTLADFGISAMVSDLESAGVAGYSLPWSPPEVLTGESLGAKASDVYSLGATIFTLIAGRSPFTVPGIGSTEADLESRIRSGVFLPTGRRDVPVSLERELARALAKDPPSRHGSPLALARALQAVQADLGHAVTPVDILDDSVTTVGEDDTLGRTRIRPVSHSVGLIDPMRTNRHDRRTAASLQGIEPTFDAAVDATVLREVPAIEVRGGEDAHSIVPPAVARGVPHPLIAATGALLLVLAIAGVAGWVLLARNDLSKPPDNYVASQAATTAAADPATSPMPAETVDSPQLTALRTLTSVSTCSDAAAEAAVMTDYVSKSVGELAEDPSTIVSAVLESLAQKCGALYGATVARRVAFTEGVPDAVAAAASSIADLSVEFPAPPDATTAQYLYSPMRNITCALSTDGVGCSILERSYAPSEDCSARVFSIEIRGGDAIVTCGPEWTVPPYATGVQMDYGQVVTYADVACTVEDEGPSRGMTCWDTRTGHSFLVARARWSLDND